MDRVGLIVGSGTGRELVDIFRQGLNRIAKILGKQVEVIECEYNFSSYEELRTLTPDQIEGFVQNDLDALTAFYKEFYQAGGRTIFRTAINAETLYRFRQIGKALKIIYIPLAQKRLLIVRDEMQGFYTNNEYEIGEHEVRFSGSFSKENFRLIVTSTLEEAERVLQKPFEVWIVYKHHLFANLIETWSRNAFGEAEIYQPNHATDLLFQYFSSVEGKDILMVTGNETGDILHEVLICHLAIGSRNTLHSKNIYLHPDFKGIIEYQTVHGSADNIAGQGRVNPFATLRALGALVEECLDENSFSSLVENALKKVEQEGIVTPDMGGKSLTHEVTEYSLRQVEDLLVTAEKRCLT